MNRADKIFQANIQEILERGTKSESPRPKYKDGTEANSIYLTFRTEQYDLSKGEFPITSLRPVAWKSAIREMLWIWQDASNNLDVLKDKYNITWWDDWEVGEREIGQRYGATVDRYQLMDRTLKMLAENPFNRRSIMSLYQYADFDETGGLYPCAFMMAFDVRKVDGEMYLDGCLTQRSNDYLVAGHVNLVQYAALLLMVAKHFGWKPGIFTRMVNNLHIYDNQMEQANELLKRFERVQEEPRPQPMLTLNVPDGTNFYDIVFEDFEMTGYDPIKPNLRFDLAI